MIGLRLFFEWMVVSIGSAVFLGYVVGMAVGSMGYSFYNEAAATVFFLWGLFLCIATAPHYVRKYDDLSG